MPPRKISKIKSNAKHEPTPEEIADANAAAADELAMAKAKTMFVEKILAVKLKEILQNPDNPKYAGIVFTTEIFKILWRIYPQGLSYFMNYYLYNTKIDKNVDETLVNSYFGQFMENFIEYPLKSDIFTVHCNAFNTKMGSIYGNWTDLDLEVLEVYDLNTSNGMHLHEYLANTLSLKEKLDIFVKFFIESFRNDDIAMESKPGQIVYRGIVGFTASDTRDLLKPTKSFTSTSTVLQVAERHTGLMGTRIQEDSSNIMILEMHLVPGIKFVDYNSLFGTGPHNPDTWQHEIILPPGLHFEKKETKEHEKEDTITIPAKKGQQSSTQTFKMKCDILIVEVTAHAFSGGGKRHRKVTSTKK
jgi:hypothetical protein